MTAKGDPIIGAELGRRRVRGRATNLFGAANQSQAQYQEGGTGASPYGHGCSTIKSASFVFAAWLGGRAGSA